MSAPDPLLSPRSWVVITARFTSNCQCCWGEIAAGERVAYSRAWGRNGGGVAHVACMQRLDGLATQSEEGA